MAWAGHLVHIAHPLQVLSSVGVHLPHWWDLVLVGRIYDLDGFGPSHPFGLELLLE